MIIFGNKATELAKETLVGKCPNCGTQDCVDIIVFQRYGHVFWLPFFPMSKSFVSQCKQCKQVLKLKNIPSNVATDNESFRSKIKTPIWTFSGLGLLALIIVCGVYTSNQKDKKNAELILNPKSGDIYDVKITDNQFTLFKVDHVDNDTVYVQINKYETDNQTGLFTIREKGLGVYSEEMLAIGKTELKKKFDRHEIIDIDR